MNNLKKSLGIIEEVDEKEQTAYENIMNTLKPIRIESEQNCQSTILKDLDNFHKYYNQKCEEYK